jgi:hypothetical protein
MPFYVRIGPRGALLRFGMILTKMMGSVAYWRASRRRAAHSVALIPVEA